MEKTTEYENNLKVIQSLPFKEVVTAWEGFKDRKISAMEKTMLMFLWKYGGRGE